MVAGLDKVTVLAPAPSLTGAALDLTVDVLGAVPPEHSSKVVA